MNRSLTAIGFLILLAGAAHAQMTTPAPELAQFDVCMGSWEGHGTVVTAADAEPLEWTAIATFSKILDGFFVQEDVEVDIGMPAKLRFRTVYAWDPAARCFTQFSISNRGGFKKSRAHWTGSTLTTGGLGAYSSTGMPTIDKAVAKFGKDGFSLKTWRSQGAGGFAEHLQGKFTRSKKSTRSTDDPKIGLLPPAVEMSFLAGHAGVWNMKGKIIPMPGLPEMPVSGKQHTRNILGGHVEFSDIVGDPTPGAPPDAPAYKGHIYLTWDPLTSCYRSLGLDNFGSAILEKAYRLDDDGLVYYSATNQWGQMCTLRTVVKWTEDDKAIIKQVRCTAAHDPEVCFDAVLTRAKGGR